MEFKISIDDKFFDHLLDRMRGLLPGVANKGPELDFSEAPVFTSKFCRTSQDISDVLSLRKSEMGGALVCPDEAYRECCLKNTNTIKMLLLDGVLVGYWGVCPISEETFESLKCGVDHNELITKRVIDWSQPNEAGIYLYFIGAVTAQKLASSSVLGKLIMSSITQAIHFDWTKFIKEVYQVGTLKGIAVYPSTNPGASAIARTADRINSIQPGALYDTGVRVDGKELQKLYQIDDKIDVLKDYDWDKKLPFDVVWDAQQRRELLKVIES